MARIEGLPPATQQVLRLAAVAGPPGRARPAAAVSELPDDELEQALRDAVAHHVLVADAAMPTCSGTRCCARRSTPSCCPASAAGCTPATPSCSPSTARRARRASSPTTPSPRTTCRSRSPLRCAAREADRRAAPAEAFLHIERALELWDAVPDAERVTGMTEIRLTTWAAWMASASGDPDRGIALGRRALDLAEHGPPRAHGHPVPPLRHAPAGAHRPRPGGARHQLPGGRAAPGLPTSRRRRRGRRPSTRRVLCRLDLWREAGASADTAMTIINGLIPTTPTSSARGPMP